MRFLFPYLEYMTSLVGENIRAWLKRSSDDDIFSSNSKWSNEGHAYIFLMFMISDNFPEHIRAEFLSIF